MRRLILTALVALALLASVPTSSVRAATGDRKIKILSMTVDLVDPLHTYVTVSYKFRVQDKVAVDQEVSSGVITIDLGSYAAPDLARGTKISEIRTLVVAALDANATVPPHDVIE